MWIYLDINGFYQSGVNSIIILKLMSTDNGRIVYIVEKENTFDKPSCYMISDIDKIQRLIDTLRNSGSGVKYVNQTGEYSLLGFKWHEITTDNRDMNDLRYICNYTDYPINQRCDFDYVDDISLVTYSEVFGEFENDIGFPVV